MTFLARLLDAVLFPFRFARTIAVLVALAWMLANGDRIAADIRRRTTVLDNILRAVTTRSPR